ncbi:RagB/SusD family nutrient uptake outer membrane protein [Arcicella aquatica]|uniref:RagB/SusD family nutrient uptake outer membrane protein n=1 Tax=Arcicella aquatica TaxID=217141 RepID=A0ABU5QL91_9BACT|nr:RagB/SusD family nutrient uptake outer membrane protein [Arcicella aquatica]MEA5257822.1 RagB/SusD family nutrient uptake outer membrane protein [Arcicella aquatica]
MKKKYIIYTALCSMLALASCESVLDKTDLGAASPDLIAGDSVLANIALNYVYNQNLPDWGGVTAISGIGGSVYSEESYNQGSSENKYLEGTLTQADVSDFGTALNANNNYGKIRTINSFIFDLGNDKLMDNGAKNRLLAQAYFFRAWRYFELVKLYGGVPLVLTPQDAVGQEARDASFIPRNTTTQCYNRIAADLDTAMKYLPTVWQSPSANWGRVTRGAAAALKGRVLLYAASPQFNPNDVVSKWQTAYDINKQAYDILTASGSKLFADYGKMWFSEITGGVGNSEAVFITGYNTSPGDQQKRNNGWEASTRPKYSTGSGGGSNIPSWDLVKAYPMKDGKKPGASTKYTYSDQLFYKDRDPRFEKTIAYNGSTWPMTNVTNNRLWTYQQYDANAKKYVSVENGGTNGSNTGFYCRKALQTSDVAASTLDASSTIYSGTDWMEIRFAEVLLNLAEAATGVGRLDEAYTQLKVIRARAGIEAGTDGLYGLKANMTRAEMFTAILDERQIEFAFEGKRFWDLRRWKLIEKTLNGTKGTKVVIALKTTGVPSDFAATRDGLKLDDIYTNYFTVTITPNALMTRNAIAWKPEYYYFAIPQAAINNNPLIIQNNTWGGAFDPLQ